MDQIISAVDDEGNFLGYIPKMVGHRGKGRRHLAMVVLLINAKGEVLLQKRKHTIFDNVWDMTAATHPLHKPHSCHSEERSDVGIYTNQDCHALRARNDKRCKTCKQNNVDESLEEATLRCLREEWGIKEIENIRVLGKFNYFAKYGDYCENEAEPLFCENEHCAMMVGEYNGELNLNPESGYDYKWMDRREFLKDIEQNPENYSPWAVEGLKILKNEDLKV